MEGDLYPSIRQNDQGTHLTPGVNSTSFHGPNPEAFVEAQSNAHGSLSVACFYILHYQRSIHTHAQGTPQ